MPTDWVENYITAGKAVIKAKKQARKIVKPGIYYYDVANICENTILDSGCELSIPILVSLNEIATDYCPLPDDRTVIPEKGLLKITFGSHSNGYIAKSALTFNLNNEIEYRHFVNATEETMRGLARNFKPGKFMYEIGEIVEKSLKRFRLNPIINLGGHEMKRFISPTGVFIPNYKNEIHSSLIMPGRVYACIVFATDGRGTVITGEKSNIFQFVRNLKRNMSYEMLRYVDSIKKLTKQLPFSIEVIRKHKIIPDNELQKVIGYLVQRKILNQFTVLIESSKAPVAEIADTILVDEDGASLVITQKGMRYKDYSPQFFTEENIKDD